MKTSTRAVAAARLFDAEVDAAYLAEQAQRYAHRQERAKPGAHSIVVFRIGREWLGLPTPVFREVAPLRSIHSLPHRRERVVAGLTNIRGELLVCVSLAAALGIAVESEASASARLAVIGRGDDRFVFVADEIAALHRYDDADLRPLPATLAHAQAVHTRGLLDWQQRPVGVLDAELLFYSLNRHLA